MRDCWGNILCSDVPIWKLKLEFLQWEKTFCSLFFSKRLSKSLLYAESTPSQWNNTLNGIRFYLSCITLIRACEMLIYPLNIGSCEKYSYVTLIVVQVPWSPVTFLVISMKRTLVLTSHEECNWLAPTKTCGSCL